MSLLALLALAAAPDLIFSRGRVWTGGARFAEAVAVEGTKIASVGSAADVLKLAGPGTRRVDLRGRLLIPGFNDAHIHLLGGAMGLAEIDLTGACTLEEMTRRIAAWAKANPDKPWVRGRGWEYTCFPGKTLPHRSQLDAVVPDRPAFLAAYDGHTAWVNSKALRIAEITRDTKFNGFGEVVKDPDGTPSGALLEGAQGLVRRHLPPSTREERLASLERGLRLMRGLGITSIQNANGDAGEMSLYEDLERAGKLTLRVTMASSIGPNTKLETAAALSRRYRGTLLRMPAVKIAVDGVIESHTAAMLEPYADAPETRGTPAWTGEQLNGTVAEADRLGLQVYTHAIGDRGVRMTLDAYEAAARANGPRDRRHRVEHIESLHPQDLIRFGKLNVIASMMPIHAYPSTIEVWSRAVGPARLPLSFAWAAIAGAGGRLAFSSDWPASITADPVRGLHCAVNRRTLEGEPPTGWLPEQRVTVTQALEAYTSGAAYAAFEENVKGTIAPGMLADLVVLSKDVFAIDPMKIHEARVDLTIFNGRVVHEATR